MEDTLKEMPEGDYSILENEVLVLLNQYRVSQNIEPLKRAELISEVSYDHTLYMIDSDELSHDNFNNRHSELVSKAKASLVGENVAFGYYSAKGVVNGWIASASHKLIIETSAYTHFGIAISKDKEGRNYFTNIFIKR